MCNKETRVPGCAFKYTEWIRCKVEHAGGTMAEQKALYSTCVAVLGFVCFVVGATAVGLPMWGYFDTPGGGFHYLRRPKNKCSFKYSL